MEKVSRLEAEEELQVEVDCGQTDKLTVELNLGIAEMFVSGLRYTIAIAFTLFIFCLVRYKCFAAGQRGHRRRCGHGDGQEVNCSSAEVVKKQRSVDKVKINMPWRR